MKVKINRHSVTVKGVEVRKAIRSRLFRRWTEALDPVFIIGSVEIQSVDTVKRNGEERVLFLKLKAEITDGKGRAYPGIAFLRGDSVAILVILKTSQHQYVVVVESHMPAIGKRNYIQLPAGMMDDETDPVRVALREMKEETGLTPSAAKMTNLGGIYPSPGACDEMVHLFLYEAEVKESDIISLQGRTAGMSTENEHLTVKLVKLEELCRKSTDPKAHSAYMLYRALKTKGN